MAKKDSSLQDTLHQLAFSKKERMSIFREVPINNQGFILLELSQRVQKDILKQLKKEEIVSLLNYLDLDKVTRLLREVSKLRQAGITKSLGENIRKKIEFLMKFSPATAAGLMSLDYIEVKKDTPFEQVLQAVEEHEQATDKAPAVLVIKDGFLVGELPLYRLGSRPAHKPIANFVEKVPFVQYDQKENEVLRVFRKHPHEKIVVIDGDKSILGIIHSDDLLGVIDRKSRDSIYRFVGVKREEDVFDSFKEKVRNRYKWLIVNLFTAFLAASVISLFEETISKLVLLAIYIPVVSGMGGNAATQTLVVVVRGMALKKIGIKTGFRIALNEVAAGMVNGAINGSLVAIIAILWSQNPLLGVVVGVSTMINLIVAGFFGTIIPFILKALGKDPASSAAVFITTTTDIIGFFTFLGLASLVLT